MHRSTIWRATKRAAARAANYLETNGWTRGVLFDDELYDSKKSVERGSCACLYGAAIAGAIEEAEAHGYDPLMVNTLSNRIVALASRNLGQHAITWNDTEAKGKDEVVAELCKVAA